MKKFIVFLLPYLLLWVSVIAEEPSLKTIQSDPSSKGEHTLVLQEQTPETPTHNFGLEFLKMMVILGIIIALLLFITHYMKRFTQSRIMQLNESSNIKILDTRGISTKTAIYIVEIEGERFALAESHSGTILLGKL